MNEKPKVEEKETVTQEEKLWAQYGKSQAQREVLSVQLQQMTRRMSQIYSQIIQIQQKKE